MTHNKLLMCVLRNIFHCMKLHEYVQSYKIRMNSTYFMNRQSISSLNVSEPLCIKEPVHGSLKL